MFNNWMLIILLSFFTFLSRVIGVEIMAKREMKPVVRLYFSYVPIAIISALIINQILTNMNGKIIISIPVLMGCTATAISIKIIKIFIPSIVIGMSVGLLVRFLII